jgi:hypothetical protein
VRVAGWSKASGASTVPGKTFCAPPDGVGDGNGAGRRVVGRRAGVCGAAVDELFAFCATAETAHDKASAATSINFLNIKTPM